MLNIQISRVSGDGERFDGEEAGRILDLAGDPYAREAGPVRYRLFAQVVSGELVLSGSVESDLKLACARCGEFFSTTVSDSSFLRAYDISEGVDFVDVTPDLREAILLYLPAFPQCKSDCAGLCPQCGANLNSGPCSCTPPAGGGEWGALDSLQLE